jgi:hypothetical protein
MKIFSNILFFLSFVFAALWGFFYIYVMSLACAFGSPNTSKCSIRMPWDLNSEDFTFLIGIPAILLTVLVILAILLRKSAAKTKRTNPSE